MKYRVKMHDVWTCAYTINVHALVNSRKIMKPSNSARTEVWRLICLTRLKYHNSDSFLVLYRYADIPSFSDGMTFVSSHE